MLLAEKIIWITGASSGLGEALALESARNKAKLVLSARREDELNRVRSECSKYIPESDILVLPLDMGSLTDADGAARKVLDRFGRIDVLINNAGIAQRSFGGDTPIEVERRIMEVNYFGVVLLTKAVIPVMRNQKQGHIAVISSLMGKLGFPGRSSYAASKHALHGYFESLRIEEKSKGISVHILCPGYVKTNVSLNAVNDKGELHQKMDKGQSKGMAASKAARIVLHAIQVGKFETTFGGLEMAAVWLKRWFPGLFFRLILRAGRPKF